MADIIVIANPDKPEALHLAEGVQDSFAGRRERIRVSIEHGEDLSECAADMVVVFGGDGTVLNAVQRFGGRIPPILAFNIGRLGYLAGNSSEKVMETIEDAVAERLASSSRMMLEAKIAEADGREWRVTALNEVVISPSRPGRMIPLALEVDGEDVMFSRGDGIIVATPTGSTAYALSAGGPVASPELNAIIVAPICPHQLANRPLVLGPDEKLRLEHSGDQPVGLTVDGTRSHRAGSGAVIEVGRAAHRVRLLSPPRGKFKTLREKLGWGWGEEKLHRDTGRLQG